MMLSYKVSWRKGKFLFKSSKTESTARPSMIPSYRVPWRKGSFYSKTENTAPSMIVIPSWRVSWRRRIFKYMVSSLVGFAKTSTHYMGPITTHFHPPWFPSGGCLSPMVRLHYQLWPPPQCCPSDLGALGPQTPGMPGNIKFPRDISWSKK